MIKPQPSICAVIVNYNGENYQNDCIKSLYAMKYTKLKILVVDSASSDNSVEVLKSEYPEVEVIACSTNVGVAKGNNIGIDYSIKNKFDYTLLLNNDIEVDEKMLEYMIERANENTVVVPKIYYYTPHDMIWFAGGKLDWKKGSAEHFGIQQIDKGQYDKKMYITYAPTCCMLLHNSTFKRIGMIDEEYFMYFDDTDLCARLNENRIKICYEPKAIMWHKVSSSSGGENSKTQVYYSYRNQLKYIKKNKNKITITTKLYVYSRAATKFLLGCMKKNNDRFILKAYRDYFKGAMGRCDNL